MTIANKQVPELRFKGFTDDWKQRKLGDLAEITSASRVHKDEWTSSGVRFLRSSDIVSSFNGTSNTPAFISRELYSKLIKKSGQPLQGDILITGGGSIGVPYIISQPYPVYFKDADSIWMKQSTSFRSGFMYFFLQSPGYKRYLSQVSHVGTIAHYTIEQVQATPIKLPTINEQGAIEEFLTTLNDTIALHQRKQDLLKKLKQVYLQKLFPRKDKKVPELRFPGYTGDWEQRKLKDLIAEYSEFVTGFKYPVATSSRRGLFLQEDYFEGGRSDTNTNVTFHVVPEEYVTYRHMSDDAIFHFNKNTLGTPVEVSREYPVFTANQNANIDFIVQHLNSSSRFLYFSETRKKGGTRTRLYFKVLEQYQLYVPNKSEQNRIANLLVRLDKTIALHQREIDELQRLKTAYLQKLFV